MSEAKTETPSGLDLLLTRARASLGRLCEPGDETTEKYANLAGLVADLEADGVTDMQRHAVTGDQLASAYMSQCHACQWLESAAATNAPAPHDVRELARDAFTLLLRVREKYVKYRGETTT